MGAGLSRIFLHLFPLLLLLGGCLGYREQVQYLCLVSHSSNNSRPSIYHMDMVCQCLWPRTLQGFSPLPFHPSVAVPAFWPSPVPSEASLTFQLKMRRSIMTMITKEVSSFLGMSVWYYLPVAEGRSVCHCLFLFLDFVLAVTKQRISPGRWINDWKQSFAKWYRSGWQELMCFRKARGGCISWLLPLIPCYPLSSPSLNQ